MDEIMDFARDTSLLVIEDAAQGLSARCKPPSTSISAAPQRAVTTSRQPDL
jgi:dTDP-4-amino-4,6-dideoxygalactose transaminase